METKTAILNELKNIRAILETLMSQAPRRQLMKVPEAAKALGIGTGKLRAMITNGTIPAHCINPDGKSLHYLIDLAEAVKALK